MESVHFPLLHILFSESPLHKFVLSFCIFKLGMAEDERRSKRSRFDQTEPEPRKASRFDRRSKSPRRSRSPLTKDSRSPTVADPAAAAGQSTFSSARCETYG
jgi:hypothetical protein